MHALLRERLLIRVGKKVNGGATPAETITNTMIIGNLTAIGMVVGLSTKDTTTYEGHNYLGYEVPSYDYQVY